MIEPLAWLTPGCAATIGLVYAGQDLQKLDLGYFLEIVSGLNEPPSVRGNDIVVPGLAGRITRNRINDVVHIELRGIVTDWRGHGASPKASWRANVQAIRNTFKPTAAPALLVASLEDGTTASITARPLNIVWVENVQSLQAGVSVELEGYGDWVYA